MKWTQEQIDEKAKELFEGGMGFGLAWDLQKEADKEYWRKKVLAAQMPIAEHWDAPPRIASHREGGDKVSDFVSEDIRPNLPRYDWKLDEDGGEVECRSVTGRYMHASEVLPELARIEAENAELRKATEYFHGSVCDECLSTIVGLKQRAETAEANLKESDTLATSLEKDCVDLNLLLAEREKEIERLKVEAGNLRFKYALSDTEVPADFEVDLEPAVRVTAYIKSLRSRLATAREALSNLVDSIEDAGGHDENGDVFDIREACAALAATEDGREDHVGTDSTTD